MKKWRILLPICLALLFLATWSHAQKQPDPIAEELYPPELIGVGREAIGLTQEQEDTIQEAAEDGRFRGRMLQQRVLVETKRLESLLKQDKLDPEAVGKQASAVMDLERDAKMEHLMMLVKIKNTLTAEQQATLRKIKGQIPAFKSKLARALELAQQRKDEGQAVPELEKAKSQFEGLMREGNFKEAEALVDGLIAQLSGTNSGKQSLKR
ncbi:MAG: hypothetical protein C5B50_23225 [Verrucomicrobia bacterium]|nr:MAG: hypothetical protein C5B50_23225 [Verrucomicrobiota bacterium]